MLDEAQILRLAKGPQRHAHGRLRLHHIGQVARVVIHVRPIGPRLAVFRVHPQQVGDVAIQPVEDGLAPRCGMLLHQIAPIVFDLTEPVGNVFGQGLGAILEHQTNLRAIRRFRAKIRRGRGNTQIEALVRQNPVAQIQP